MRSPEKIIRKGSVRWQVRGPKPGGGTQYVLFKTKKAADAYAGEQDTARRGGAVVKANVTYQDLVKEFQGAHYIGLRPSAARDYDRSLARAGRYLNGKLLRAIRTADIEVARDKELARIRVKKPGGGALSVNKMVRSLRTLFKFGQSRGYIVQNVATFVKRLKTKPTHEKPKDTAVLTPKELSELIAATDPNWRTAIGILGYGGLRIGELLGLQWSDVELDRGRILVRRQVCGVSGEFREPKTVAGTRFIELPPDTIKELRSWRLRCPKKEVADLLFPNENGGAFDYHNFSRRVFLPALRRAGLRRVRIHDLRHGCASMLIAAGADIAAVSRQLGHANVSITLSVYSHWFKRRDDAGLGAKLAAFLAAESGGCESVADEKSKSQPAP